MTCEAGFVDVMVFPKLERKCILKINLSQSGAMGLGTELINWSYNCVTGGHFHIEPKPYKYICESLGVFCLPDSSKIIIESGFSNHEPLNVLLSDDYDVNCDNTISVKVMDLCTKDFICSTIQFSLDKLSMRAIGKYLCSKNDVGNILTYSTDKAISEISDIFVRLTDKNIYGIEVNITENRCIDDYY